jgi:hypothetical protein
MRMLGPSVAVLTLAVCFEALAASPPPVELCNSLDKQWREELPQHHPDAAQLHKAKSLHAEGFTLCLAGKTEEGVLKLEEALQDLGVQPEI